MANYAPPSLSSPTTYKPTYKAPKLGPQVSGIAGVMGSTLGTRGAPVNSPVAQQVADRTKQQITPLQTFQNKVKQQLEDNKSKYPDPGFSAFKQKYGIDSYKTYQKFRTTRTNNVAVSRNTGGNLYKGYAGSRGSWNGYRNGQIPAAALSRISFAPNAMLRSDAANALEKLNAAFRAQFGRDISITDSYRSYAAQVSLKRTKGNMAATPGTSIHGLGAALDLGGGINKAGSAENAWLNQHGPQYGWVNPAWAKSRNKFEPWHFEYVGG